ncbi:MAG: glycosyl hydrolase family 65 protein [Bacillota bacterium]|nr:glycosyl hydrolase family 65 protein [Bacillota bacterium]
MASKVADRYLKVDPWEIIEEGFIPKRGRISESMFCLANEFMGIRGYFEEGYSGNRLLGSYFNNLYEEMEAQHWQLFKGIITRVCFGVNSVDWLYTRIILDGEQLDLAKSIFSDFSRVLDMKKGVMTRTFNWKTVSGKELKLTFIRFLSMDKPNMGFQKITFEPLNFSGSIQIRSGLDYSILHEIAEGWNQTESADSEYTARGKNFWTMPKAQEQDGMVMALGTTVKSGHQLFSSFRLNSNMKFDASFIREEKLVALDVSLELKQGEISCIEKAVTNFWEKSDDADCVFSKGIKLAKEYDSISFENAYNTQVSYWEKAWENIDIPIEGDDEKLQGVRLSIFSLYSTYHGFDASLNIPCKGLTGEVYHGQVFWDTESYCMPFYIFNNPKAAKNLLLYRHKYLPQACERAEQLDCEGARYPMCALDGTESCATWQHGDFEIHVSVAIAYAAWLYNKLCKDKNFLYNEGIELLMQISRYYAKRGEYSPLNGEFGLYGVMGPDEYHMNINNNTYTNVMVKKTFEFTLEVIEEMKKNAPDLLERVSRKVSLREIEPLDWKNKADKMRIPMDKKTGLIEQHDGYFDLPEVDVKNIPESQIPIYKNWAYVRIFRYNMIKQPDVLLLPFFFSTDYSIEQKKLNYEYYEARCIHESSLSPSIHSILAAELGKNEQSYEFFNYMARLDLDNYNKNTDQGLHVTSMSGAWLNMVYGFGGLRTDGELLIFKPSIPEKWKSFSFKLNYEGALLSIKVDKKNAEFKILSGPNISILVYDNKYIINPEGIKIPLQELG